MQINDRLREIRKKSGLNQKEMATRLKISLGAYQNYEQGKRQLIGTVLTEYALMGYNVHWIMTGKQEIQLDPFRDDFFQDVREWLKELEEDDDEIKYWFRHEFKRKFPEFKEWLKKRDGDSQHTIPQRKTA